MTTPPDFSSGAVLTAAQMNSVGLWLVKTQVVGTGVSSVTVSSAFSTDYDSYKIIYSGGLPSTSNHLGLRLGSTTTLYYGGLVYNASASATPAGALDTNASSFSYAAGGNVNYMLLNCDLHNPFLTKYTMINASNLSFENYGMYNAALRDNTSYTAFTLIPSAGTITGGTIRIYGYRN